MRLCLPLLLLACPVAEDTQPGDTASAADTGPVDTGDPDTGDSGDPDTGATLGLDCGELLVPWPVASGEDAWTAARLAGPPLVELVSLEDQALGWSREAAQEFDCPTVTENEATGTVVISGDCGNAIGAWSGTATFVTSAAGDYMATYEDFSFESYTMGMRLAADGTWGADATSFFFDLALDYNVGEAGEDWGVIAWALEGDFGDATHMEGRVDVTDSPEGAGSFCIVVDDPAYSGSCVEESPSTLEIQGSAYAAVVFDPDADPVCDGCASVTIDGEDAGQICL